MLSFRQVSTVVWTFLAFMVAAALVLNLRYKPIGEGELRYLDTWTGRIHAVEAKESPVRGSVRGLEITVLERLLRHEAERNTCSSVRFAFPARTIDGR